MHPLFDNDEHLLPMKILIVEDDAEVRDVLKLALSPHHFVIEASNAIEGVKRHESENLDLILTDLSMPGMSGVELIKQIRKTDEIIPILAISGINSQLRLADQAGADASLMKPFTLSQLLQTVEQLLPSRD